MPGTAETVYSDADVFGVAADRLIASLRERCGLKRDDLLERKVHGVLRQRAPSLMASWVDDLLARPVNDRVWLDVLDAVTIHETYFFRDPGQLQVLRHTLLPDLIARRAAANDRRISFWSAGCASGEEAYSLAILVLQALEQAGEKADHWAIEILGTDISAAMIGLARQGVYGGPGLNAFRQMPEDHDAYFENVEHLPGRRRVVSLVHALPRFRQHNLMDATPPVSGVDIALCRNVFIYFDEQAQHQAVVNLASAVSEGGFLLLGVTDRLSADCAFVREPTGTAVVYRRVESGS